MKAKTSLVATVIMVVFMLIGLGMFLAVSFGKEENETLISSFVTYGLILIVIGFIGTLFSTVFGVLVNPAQLKGVLFGILAIVVVGGISYLLADSTVLPSYKGAVDESTSKLVSTGLNAFYIVGTLAVLSLVYSGVAKLFK